MKRQEFIKTVGTTPKTTAEAVRLADKHNIIFKRRVAYLKAWFGKGNGRLSPSGHNLIG